jgi:hypothetical protein
VTGSRERPGVPPPVWTRGRSRGLGDRLRGAEPPDAAGTQERAWEVVRASATARPVPRRRAPRLALAGAALVALGAVIASGTAAAPAEWALDQLRPAASTRAERLTPLPSPGRLLLHDPAAGTVRLLSSDGRSRPLGRWAGASWSPRGRFVVVWRGRRLAALTPKGRLRWSISAPSRVLHARWSPDGFRIAYVTAGRSLWIANGDGTGARRLAPALGAAPAWRPGAPHTLAWVRPDRTIAVRDADTLAIAARPRAPVSPNVVELSFSADGSRLLAWSPGEARLHHLDRDTSISTSPGRGRIFTGAAFAPRGSRLALARARLRGPQDAVVTVGTRRVLTGQGAFTSLAWSPDGAAIAAAWPRARQAIAAGVTRPSVAALPSGDPQGWAR